MKAAPSSSSVPGRVGLCPPKKTGEADEEGRGAREAKLNAPWTAGKLRSGPACATFKTAAKAEEIKRICSGDKSRLRALQSTFEARLDEALRVAPGHG